MADAYLVIHFATSCDEHGVFVSKEAAEVTEIAWILMDATTLEELSSDSVSVRPINTSNLSTLAWEQVRNAGGLSDAINRLDQFIHETIIAKGLLDFTFVTLNAWDLRVQLPREARDKGVMLPTYLLYPKVFDLKIEFSKWQAHHPEALSFSATNLMSICNALEVEVPQNSAPIRTNVPPYIQAPSTRRAMEESNILSRVLKALAARSLSTEEHRDVLVKPLDARADVAAFLTERSKILYMSNLPYDTTQSELESWFTQYGGRPIAFWTLKTPDPQKPTGTGFAVFSSHEEATDSLAMNGRSLNEKTIEVSPSSSRVLDRAQEILTPFPPSKNRPRPGDWTCPSCGFSNFQRRTACFRCSFPASQAAVLQESLYNNYGGKHANNNSNNIHNNGHGYHQQGLQQHGGNLPYSGHNNNSSSNSVMGSNGGNNYSGSGRGASSVPFRAGDWKCAVESCSYHNFAKNISCLRCGAPRSLATGNNGNNHKGHHDGSNNSVNNFHYGTHSMKNSKDHLNHINNVNNGSVNSIQSNPSIQSLNDPSGQFHQFQNAQPYNSNPHSQQYNNNNLQNFGLYMPLEQQLRSHGQTLPQTQPMHLPQQLTQLNNQQFIEQDGSSAQLQRESQNFYDGSIRSQFPKLQQSRSQSQTHTPLLNMSSGDDINHLANDVSNLSLNMNRRLDINNPGRKDDSNDSNQSNSKNSSLDSVKLTNSQQSLVGTSENIRENLIKA